MKVFSVINEKGGVGKSSLTINLGYGLSKKGLKVLLVDADPQHNISSKLVQNMTQTLDESGLKQFSSKVQEESVRTLMNSNELLRNFLEYSESDDFVDLSDVLEDPNKIHLAIQHTKYDFLDILPSTHSLSVVDYKLKNARNRDNRLRMALNKVKDIYDVVIIDNSPFESALTYNSISACRYEGDQILIPTKMDYESWEGLHHTIETLLAWLDETELDYDFKIVPMMTSRTNSTKMALNTLKALFGHRVFDVDIRYQANPIEKSSFEKEILLASEQKAIQQSGVFQDFNELIEEFYDKCMA